MKKQDDGLDADVLRVQSAYPRIYHACHTRHGRRASTSSRLSAHDSALLSHLGRDLAITPSALARHMSVGAATISAAIERLVELGYVKRRRATADRRRIELLLTDAGVRAMSNTSVLDKKRVRALLERLTPDERRRAVDGLSLLARAGRS